MLSSVCFKTSLMFLNEMCFLDLLDTFERSGDTHCFVGPSGLILFKLKSLDPSKSRIVREALEFPLLAKYLLQLKSCSKHFRMLLLNSEQLQRTPGWVLLGRVENSVFKQEPGKPGINLGLRMDVVATSDDEYFERLSMNQPEYLCEHNKISLGNACPECNYLAKQRIFSVYRKDYMMSRDETLVRELYGVIYSLGRTTLGTTVNMRLFSPSVFWHWNPWIYTHYSWPRIPTYTGQLFITTGLFTLPSWKFWVNRRLISFIRQGYIIKV